MCANLIVDSGYQRNYRDLKGIMQIIKDTGQQVDGIILTHIDDDHIGGITRWLRNEFIAPPINKIIFNTSGGLISRLLGDSDAREASEFPRSFEDELRFLGSGTEYSAQTAISLYDLMLKNGLTDKLICDSLTGTLLELPFGATLSFIIPSIESAKEFVMNWNRMVNEPGVDYGASQLVPSLDSLMEKNIPADSSPTNGGSLAFLFDYEDIHLAFLGDAHADVCENGLRAWGYSEEKPYQATVIKLSHHGSAANLSAGLLELLSGNTFIMSSSEKKLSITQKTTIAHLLKHREQVTVYTNFTEPSWFFTDEDRRKYIGTGKLTLKKAGQGTWEGSYFSIKGRI